MMNITKLLILVLVFISNTTIAQQKLDKYKYVIVSKKFDFQKYEDQYQLNSLTKFLFKKEGFIAIFENEKELEDLFSNPCLALKAKVKNESGMFATKLIIELLDCRNNIVFVSVQGKSKQKEYKKAYHAALREAFQSITSLGYKYIPAKDSVIAKKEEIAEVQEPVNIVEVVTPIVTEAKEKSVEVIEKVTHIEVVKEEEVVKDVPFAIIEDKTENILYAQNILNGFQLVDSTPKIVFKALKSLKGNIYFLENKAGIIFKKDNQWFAEYYKGKAIVKEKLNIKF